MMQNGLYEIYTTWHVPFWQTRAFYSGISLLVAFCVALLVYYSVRAIRQRRAHKTSWDRALIALEELRTHHMQPATSEQFYVRLTAILKKYVHERYGFDVMSKTDHEFIVYMHNQTAMPQQRALLNEIMEGSVMIKFAHAQALQEQMQHDIENAIAFIQSTIERVD